jgi:hypothetical protein
VNKNSNSFAESRPSRRSDLTASLRVAAEAMILQCATRPARCTMSTAAICAAACSWRCLDRVGCSAWGGRMLMLLRARHVVALERLDESLRHPIGLGAAHRCEARPGTAGLSKVNRIVRGVATTVVGGYTSVGPQGLRFDCSECCRRLRGRQNYAPDLSRTRGKCMTPASRTPRSAASPSAPIPNTRDACAAVPGGCRPIAARESGS